MRFVNMPIGYALFFLLVQIIVLISPSAPINKEVLGVTVTINLIFLGYAIFKYQSEKKEHEEVRKNMQKNLQNMSEEERRLLLLKFRAMEDEKDE